MIEGAGDDGDEIMARGDLAESKAQAGELAGTKQFISAGSTGKFHLSAAPSRHARLARVALCWGKMAQDIGNVLGFGLSSSDEHT